MEKNTDQTQVGSQNSQLCSEATLLENKTALKYFSLWVTKIAVFLYLKVVFYFALIAGFVPLISNSFTCIDNSNLLISETICWDQN